MIIRTNQTVGAGGATRAVPAAAFLGAPRLHAGGWAGLAADEIKRVIDPMESFHLQLKEEVDSYERLKRREFDEIDNFRGFGHLLISLRIAQGMTQRELARRLGVHESQISRDERNEYFGVTLERAMKVLEALHVRLRSKVEIEAPPWEAAMS